jgi:hypothetical protein
MTDLILLNPIPASMVLMVAFWIAAEAYQAHRERAARLAVRSRRDRRPIGSRRGGA